MLSSRTLTKETGRRMAPPLQASHLELHHLVSSRRHNPHQPPSSILSHPSPLELPLHCPLPARPKPKKDHPTRRSPPRRLRRHRPRPEYRHPTPRLRPAPLPNLHPFRTKSWLAKSKQTPRHRALADETRPHRERNTKSDFAADEG